MIDTNVLEDTLVSLVNDVRLMENKGSLVRASALDELARTNSRLMADSEQLGANPIETTCGGSGTHVVQWPQVKSFNYRGPVGSPTSTTPTNYDKTARGTAAGVVEYINENEDSYIKDPDYRYVGVGVVQTPDELGFMDFWVTFYVADCLDEAPTETSTPTAATPSPTPTPAARATPTVVPSSLREFENGRWLEQQDPELASSIKELGWVEDGIEGIEYEVIENLLYVAVLSRTVASAIVSFDWVQDGVDGEEAEALGWLNNIGSAEVATSVVSLGWVEDGIEALEVQVIEELSYLANRDAGAAIRIAGMPFVETIEPPDVSAMTSLGQLAAFGPGTFVRVMAHPTVRAGISDDWAPIVATLNGVAKTNSGLIDVLLDSSRVTLEQRTITLPLAGEVLLFIIRTGPGAARSMDLLEHSVRSAEEFMNTPLPTNFVSVLYAEAVYGDYAGTNFGTHIAILPKFDIDDGSRDAEFAGSNNAHEVAHYYWSGNEDWVDEGAANFMASFIDGARTGRPIVVSDPPCGHAGSLAELESLGISVGDVEYLCNYSLGERLFVDLYRTLGHERFQQSFRDLYLLSAIEDEADDLPGTVVGIEHVGEVLRFDDGMESVVISRWYDGTEPYELSDLDTGPVDSSLPSINGRIEKAYVITSLDGPAVTTFSAQGVSDHVYLALEYAYAVSGGPHEVPLEIVEYYEDGFEFSRNSGELTAEAKYIGGTSWFAVGQPPPRKWSTGRYWVYVYAGDQKVAEVSYEVTP